MVARRRHACCRTRRSQGSKKVGDMYPSVKISAVLAQRGESVFRCVSLVRHALRQKLLCFCFLFRSRLGLASTQTQAAASTHTHPYTERPKDTIEKTTDSLLLRCLVGDERVLLHALCKATKYEHELGWLACHPLGLLVTAFRFSSITYVDVACVQPRRKKKKKTVLTCPDCCCVSRLFYLVGR